METFELLSWPHTIHRGLRILLKNSFLHAEGLESVFSHKSSSRRHSAPPVSRGHQEFPKTENSDTRTTLMIRNIPSRFSQQSFLTCISDKFNLTQVNFFYLPVDFKTGKSLGYSFINFESPEALSTFMAIFQGAKLNSNSTKLLSIDHAKIQGYEKNYNVFRTSSVMIVAPCEFRPMIKCPSCKSLAPLSNSDKTPTIVTVSCECH